MTAHDPNLSARRSRFWHWLGRSPEAEAAGVPAELPEPRSLRDMRLELQRPLLGEIGDFLATHGLELMPYTLTIAYDCVTGYSPRLTELVRERSESGQPITLGWLEEVARDSGRVREETLLSTLMSRLEESIDEFSRNTLSARDAASDYNVALRQHVDDLEKVGKAGVVISELATLTKPGPFAARA